MYHHVKKLMYTVRVDTPDPSFGNMLLEQFGGANGELAAAMQYSVQGLNCDDLERKDLLMDIGTEELSHLEVVGALARLHLKPLKFDRDAAEQDPLIAIAGGDAGRVAEVGLPTRREREVGVASHAQEQAGRKREFLRELVVCCGRVAGREGQRKHDGQLPGRIHVRLLVVNGGEVDAMCNAIPLRRFNSSPSPTQAPASPRDGSFTRRSPAAGNSA